MQSLVLASSMRSPCCSGLFISLLILLESSGVFCSPPVPEIQCPVGVSIDAALYFKTVGGVTSPASVTSNISSMTATERRAELQAELAELVRLSGSQSDSELVNLASLYYGLTETLKTEATTTNLGPAQLRDLAEVEVSSALSGLSDAARAYLPWIFGSLSDQQLILIACGAQFTVPTGLTASLTAPVLTESV